MEENQKEIEEAIELRRQDLEKLCTGRKVDLNALELDDLDVLCVAITLIRRESPIESLYLGSNLIKDEGMEALCSAFAKHTELKELYIGSNNFQDPGLNHFMSVFPELTNLCVLSLGLSHLNDSSCTSLAGSMLAMSSCSLSSLFLNGNSIGDEGLLSLMYSSI